MIAMTKALESSSTKRKAARAPTEQRVVRESETGAIATIKGLGALKDAGLEIEKGVDLLKPIAEQVFGRRIKRRKVG